MDGPDLWDALRERGLEADDPEVRTAVRTALDVVGEVRERLGQPRARRCAEAMGAALSYALQHPDTSDMSSFEHEFEGDEE